MLRSPAMTALRAKYGKYVPHQRANVDQVPLPFVNDMETTYEEVGAKRVCINQQGPGVGAAREGLRGRVVQRTFLVVWSDLVRFLRGGCQIARCGFLMLSFLNAPL